MTFEVGQQWFMPSNHGDELVKKLLSCSYSFNNKVAGK